MAAKKERLYEQSKMLDIFFDVFFAGLVGAAVYLYTMEGRLNEMLTGWGIVVVFIITSNFLTLKLAPIFSRAFLSHPAFGDPLHKVKTLEKFRAQWWQLSIHVLLTLATLKTVGNEDWFMVPEHLLSPAAFAPGATSEALDMLYNLQLSIWFVTLCSHRFFEERHKDYYVMTAHHVCTIALVLMSFMGGEQRIGICIMYVHDISDIPIDLLKIVNLLKLEGPPGFFLSEMVYAGNLVSWIYHRLGLFPYVITYKAIMVSCFLDTYFGYTDTTMVTLKGACDDGIGGTDGAICHPDGLFTYYTGCPVGIWLILSLQVMHIWWTYLLLRIGYKTIFGGMKGHAAGAEDYEGNSSDDEGKED